MIKFINSTKKVLMLIFSLIVLIVVSCNNKTHQKEIDYKKADSILDMMEFVQTKEESTVPFKVDFAIINIQYLNYDREKAISKALLFKIKNTSTNNLYFDKLFLFSQIVIKKYIQGKYVDYSEQFRNLNSDEFPFNLNKAFRLLNTSLPINDFSIINEINPSYCKDYLAFYSENVRFFPPDADFYEYFSLCSQSIDCGKYIVYFTYNPNSPERDQDEKYNDCKWPDTLNNYTKFNQFFTSDTLHFIID